MYTFDKVEEALEDLRNGKIVLVTDEPNRENEGDFICAAQFATTENINFMATHTEKVLSVCRCQRNMLRNCRFPQMVNENTDNHKTAFTVSIDHVSTTTGISAAERSITAMKCVEDGVKPKDFSSPRAYVPASCKRNTAC